MRLTLLAAALLLALHTCFAAIPAIAPLPAAAAARTAFPKPHLRFKERKGTMGFVYAVVLGPIGYFGVKLFSRHNDMMCYQATRGFKIWGLIIATSVILAGSALLFPNSDFPSGLLTSLWANP